MRKAYELFVLLGGYENSNLEAEECERWIQEVEHQREELENEEIYQEANRLENSESMQNLKRAIQLYGRILSWKDSDERYKRLNGKLEEIKAKEQA